MEVLVMLLLVFDRTASAHAPPTLPHTPISTPPLSMSGIAALRGRIFKNSARGNPDESAARNTISSFLPHPSTNIMSAM
jgi:hypothetical protein